jgi:hypothetical protein
LNLSGRKSRVLDARAMKTGPYRDHVWVLVDLAETASRRSGASSRLRLYRLQSNTDPDESFGSGGFVDLPLKTHSHEQAFLPFADGRVLIIGHLHPELAPSKPLVLAQLLLPNGRPDPMFGQSGSAYVPFAPGSKHGLTIEQNFHDTKILVFGHQEHRPAIYRLNLDGTLDR